MKHITITVNGKVQGVYFRAFTQKEAERLNLKGFVRNERNGDVYIEAEGEDANLNQLVNWCQSGSPKALVKDIKVSEGEVKGFSEFVIQR
ncbi:MAG TPA: acylphosphatase [Bacteroidia bacterium]|jgi:acylphosphatase|nr:acylphosphatase [Bacteroidia bacterium]